MLKENIPETTTDNLELRKNNLLAEKNLLDTKYMTALDERAKYYDLELYEIYRYTKRLKDNLEFHYYLHNPIPSKEDLTNNYNKSLKYQSEVIEPIKDEIKSIQIKLDEIYKQESENYQKAFDAKKDTLLKTLYSNLDATYNKIPKPEIDSGMTTENSLKSHPEIANESETLEYYISKIENEVTTDSKLDSLMYELKLRKLID